jgi:hypothetical protein
MATVRDPSQSPPVVVPPAVEVPNELPDPDPMPQHDPGVTLPPVPGGTNTPGRGVTTVSTQAIRTFAANLLLLEEPIRTALTGMAGVDVRPGAFNQAFVLANKIDGDGELRDSTRDVLTKALDALVAIRQACHRIVTEYDTAEELNNADATRFQELVNSANSIITGLGE